MRCKHAAAREGCRRDQPDDHAYLCRGRRCCGREHLLFAADLGRYRKRSARHAADGRVRCVGAASRICDRHPRVCAAGRSRSAARADRRALQRCGGLPCVRVGGGEYYAAGAGDLCGGHRDDGAADLAAVCGRLGAAERTRARGRNDSGGADHRDGIRASGKRPARCVCRMAERVSLRRHPHGDFGDRAGAGDSAARFAGADALSPLDREYAGTRFGASGVTRLDGHRVHHLRGVHGLMDDPRLSHPQPRIRKRRGGLRRAHLDRRRADGRPHRQSRRSPRHAGDRHDRLARFDVFVRVVRALREHARWANGRHGGVRARRAGNADLKPSAHLWHQR